MIILSTFLLLPDYYLLLIQKYALEMAKINRHSKAVYLDGSAWTGWELGGNWVGTEWDTLWIRLLYVIDLLSGVN